MKSRLLIIIFFLLLSEFAGAANITGWKLTRTLVGDNIFVGSTSTEVSGEIYCSRNYGEDDFTIKFAVGTINSNGQKVILGGPYIINASHFQSSGGGMIYAIRVFSFNVTADQITNNRLFLFTYCCGDQLQQSFQSYQTTNTTVIPPTYTTNDLYTGQPLKFPDYYRTSNYRFNTVREPLPSGTRIEMNDNLPVLSPGQSIYSPNQTYRLTLQTAGNIVLYRKNSDGSETAIWANNSVYRYNTVASVILQSEGNLVAYKGTTRNSTPDWSTQVYDLGGSTFRYSNNQYLPNDYAYPFFYLQDNGQLIEFWPSKWKNPTVHQVAGTPTIHNNFEVYIIIACSDTPYGAVSSHFGNLTPELWYNGNYEWVKYGDQFELSDYN
ncbi:hypothetical protein [Mucilaginibacter galii]|uniref:hypothetical protein n=1 Tax=Mucilaginibacter galii TaxID=2005073 RepID=UPI00166E1471|nr:hypothetical protein [Mucilaginibacter galii]